MHLKQIDYIPIIINKSSNIVKITEKTFPTT